MRGRKRVTCAIPSLRRRLGNGGIVFNPTMYSRRLAVTFVRRRNVTVRVVRVGWWRWWRAWVGRRCAVSSVGAGFVGSLRRVAPRLLRNCMLTCPSRIGLNNRGVIMHTGPGDRSGITVIALNNSNRRPTLDKFMNRNVLSYSIINSVFTTPNTRHLFRTLRLVGHRTNVLLIILGRSNSIVDTGVTYRLTRHMNVGIGRILARSSVDTNVNTSVGSHHNLTNYIPLCGVLNTTTRRNGALSRLIRVTRHCGGGITALTITVHSYARPRGNNAVASLPRNVVRVNVKRRNRNNNKRGPLMSTSSATTRVMSLLYRRLGPGTNSGVVLVVGNMKTAARVRLGVVFHGTCGRLRTHNLRIIMDHVRRVLAMRRRTNFRVVVTVLSRSRVSCLGGGHTSTPC